MHWGAGTGGELTGSLADDESMGERIDGGGGWGRLAVGISVCVCVCLCVYWCIRVLVLHCFSFCIAWKRSINTSQVGPSPPHHTPFTTTYNACGACFSLGGVLRWTRTGGLCGWVKQHLLRVKLDDGFGLFSFFLFFLHCILTTSVVTIIHRMHHTSCNHLSLSFSLSPTPHSHARGHICDETVSFQRAYNHFMHFARDTN